MDSRTQEQTPLVDALKHYQEKRPAYFCIPGHRYERGISPRWLSAEECGFLKYDLTEATGLDDLHQPSGVIGRAQELMAELYGACNSYFLINGSTCGNEAMILATVREGEKILIPRNAHKSVLEGLILSGGVPIYVKPHWLEEEGIFGGIDPLQIRSLLEVHPDCKRVFLVNPSYYGLCSDVASIAEICHERGALLLVDEAHGAHTYFSEHLPGGALTQGADLCVQSFHKVTGALTQSSVLHRGSERVNEGRLRQALQMVQSTSPSYLLMASLDAARYELARGGAAMMERTLELAQFGRESIAQISGLRCFGRELVGSAQITDVDLTRLIIRVQGLSGYELKERLIVDWGIELELADEKNALAIVTYANDFEDMQRLLRGLKGTVSDSRAHKEQQTPPLWVTEEMVLTPREAYQADTKTISWELAKGEIAGEMIAPYPPGIPLLYPGERITAEVWEAVSWYRSRGCHLHGPRDETLKSFEIIEK